MWQIYEPSFLAKLETLFRFVHLRVLLPSFPSFCVFGLLISPFRTDFCLFFRAGRGKPLQASAGSSASAAAAGGAASTAAASEQEDAFIEGVRLRVFGVAVFLCFVAHVSFAFAYGFCPACFCCR